MLPHYSHCTLIKISLTILGDGEVYKILETKMHIYPNFKIEVPKSEINKTRDTTIVTLQSIWFLGDMVWRIEMLKIQPIQNKNRKLNQSKLKSQKIAYGLDVFRSFFYSTVWFGLVRGFDFPNLTKPRYKKKKKLIKYISHRLILI